MTDAWDDRKKAIENLYFHNMERELIEKIKEETREKLIHKHCLGRCPKCGDKIESLEFRGVPMDQCSTCKGVWLGPKDLQLLSEKDHRNWFDQWFHAEKG